MRQGDSYPIRIAADGMALGDAAKIRFTVGPLAKEYPGEVSYDAATDSFSFPLSQSETLQLVGEQVCEAQIRYLNAETERTLLGTLVFDPSEKGTVV